MAQEIKDRFFPYRETVLPFFRLATDQGKERSTADLRQKKSGVLLFVPEPDSEQAAVGLKALNRFADEIADLNAVVWAIVSGDAETALRLRRRFDLRFDLLLDPNGEAIRSCLKKEERNGPVVLVVDRFGSIWDRIRMRAEQPLESLEQAMQTLAFTRLQCPECGVPDSPP